MFLEQEMSGFCTANHWQMQKWETIKKVIQKDDILTRKKVEKWVGEAIQADEADQATMKTLDQPRKQAPSKCTNCGMVGHKCTHCRAAKEL